MARPPIAPELRRTERIYVPLRPSEREELERAAEGVDQPLATWTRQVLLKAARATGRSSKRKRS